MITPNHHEAESVTHMRIRSAADAREAARRFRERAKSDAVLITRGEHGMWLLGPDGKDGHDVEIELPAEAREVADVTGAGDTVISALALAARGALARRRRTPRQSRRRNRRRQVRAGDSDCRRTQTVVSRQSLVGSRSRQSQSPVPVSSPESPSPEWNTSHGPHLFVSSRISGSRWRDSTFLSFTSKVGCERTRQSGTGSAGLIARS